MGWFEGLTTSSVRRRRSPSRRSTYSTHHSRYSAPSIFSFGGGSRSGRSSPSVFSSSSRRARPRSGFIQRVVHFIKRLFRDISSYARRHPFKVLLLVVVPLLTSGVLQKLFAMIGIRLPRNLLGSLGGQSSQGGGGGGGGSGMAENITGLMNVAKMFM
ncbi:uncharacterized protein ATNIH1004_001160 [Aspergillus tanneri]|uniref:Uncharacterized protein n=1 Tax=Aspergillus tanneri TaxID=1220188 RepID=A0A5M9N1T5_9EURO|nr:uncharacterized protein ATNIH1004_001160 [Aspergillus tanneri]KAA8652256.1 hypothetical protein ATNIH1004_001160 [Aspergillus tanneri]